MVSLQMYTANLRHSTEYIYRQSVMGAVGHIALNPDDVPNSPADNIRIDTLCGKNLKYGTYSSLAKRSGVVRNACVDCFTVWEPEEDEQEVKRTTRSYGQDDLGF